MSLELRLTRQNLASLYLDGHPLITGTLSANGEMQHFEILTRGDTLNVPAHLEFTPDQIGSSASCATARALLNADDAGVAFRALVILARFGSEAEYQHAIAVFHRRGGNATASLVDSMFALSTRRT